MQATQDGVVHVVTFADFDEYWRLLTDLAGATSMILETLPQKDTRAFREELERRASAYATGEGLEIPGLALTVLAE